MSESPKPKEPQLNEPQPDEPLSHELLCARHSKATTALCEKERTARANRQCGYCLAPILSNRRNAYHCSPNCQRRDIDEWHRSYRLGVRLKAGPFICGQCQRPFTPSRRGALYCGGACRQKAYRLRAGQSG
jgi:hypothetical protein